MLTIFDEAIRKRLYECIRLIREEQKAKGKYASGKSARSLRAAQWPGRGAVVGEAYFLNQEIGTPPQGQGNPPKWYVAKIGQWLRYKGKSGEEATRMAYPVARKIWRDGTRLFNGKDQPLGIPLIAEMEGELLLADMAKIAAADITRVTANLLTFGSTGDSISIRRI